MRNVIACIVLPFVAAPAMAQYCPPLYIITGKQAEETLGQTAVDVGDVNGDGITDFGVGSSSAHSDLGELFVFSGADGTPFYRLSGESQQNRFSEGLAGLGDVDGDGSGDFAVASPFYITTNGIGRVYVYSGATGDTLYTIDANAGAELLGLSLCRVDDLDGDGVSDLVAGAPQTDTVFGPESGKVFIFSGATGALIGKIAGPNGGLWFGGVVARAGDVDADGFDDLVVTATKYDFERGRVYVCSGNTGAILFSRDGIWQGGGLGTAIGAAGDVDGDGKLDVYASEPFVSGDDHVYFLDGTTGAVVQTLSSSAENGFGMQVARMGDIDGDGVGDFALANQNLDTSVGVDAGQVDFWSGATWTIFRSISGEAAHDRFGFSMVAVNDLNADGRSDLLAGAPYNPSGATNAGRAYVYLTCTAGFEQYGDGFPGTLGVPVLSPDKAPELGATVTLTLGNSSGVDHCCIAVLGASRADLPTSWGGELLVTPAFVVPMVLPAAGTTLFFNVPNDPSLCGQTWDVQTLQYDAGAARGVAFSQGLELIVGT